MKVPPQSIWIHCRRTLAMLWIVFNEEEKLGHIKCVQLLTKWTKTYNQGSGALATETTEWLHSKF